MLENILLIIVLTVIIALAAWYVIRAKKRGQKCIGCPAAGACSQKGCSACGCTHPEK